MTKKEIVKTISEEIGMTQLKTKEIVQKTFNAIVETLVEERRIELRNFGVFEVKARAARKARNPRTGQRVDVPEKFVVTFKPGKEMEEKVRELEQRSGVAGNQPDGRQYAQDRHLLPPRTAGGLAFQWRSASSDWFAKPTGTKQLTPRQRMTRPTSEQRLRLSWRKDRCVGFF